MSQKTKDKQQTKHIHTNTNKQTQNILTIKTTCQRNKPSMHTQTKTLTPQITQQLNTKHSNITTYNNTQAITGRSTNRVSKKSDQNFGAGPEIRKCPETVLGISLPGSLALHCAAFSKCCAMQCQTSQETVSKICFGALSDFKTDPEILTRLPANPTIRAPPLTPPLTNTYAITGRSTNRVSKTSDQNLGTGPEIRTCPETVLGISLPGSLALHCTAFSNAAQCGAKLPGRPILKSVSVHFLISKPTLKS